MREWRSGELYVLFLAITIAVTAVTSVNFFTDRIHLALKNQANELLGADLTLTADRKFDEHYLNEAKKRDLKVVRQLTFPSMIIANDTTQMSWLKVVDSDYPLRGKLGISQTLFAPESQVEHAVSSGKIWLEPRILTAMKLSVGDTLNIGNKTFEIDAILTSEPGRGGDLFNVAPRVLMNYADIDATQLIQPGSRIKYSLLVAGSASDILSYRSYVSELNEEGVRMQGVEDARPEIRVALSRAEQFLGLAALTSVILAGVAIALAARRFAATHMDHCAVMRCVGATQSVILKLYLNQLILLAVIASGLGVLGGFFFHEILVGLLGSLLGVDLPDPSVMPVFFGLATGIITLLGFALPPILSLKSVPALRVIRREVGAIDLPGVLSYGAGIIALAIVMIWQARDIKMGIYMVGGAMLTILVLALIAVLLIFVLRAFQDNYRSPITFGLRNLIRRPSTTIIQIIAFGLGIMSLLVLTLIRNDLLDEWQESIPADAPNRFIINIHPEQVPNVEDFFKQNGEEIPPLYPMIRGRLVKINGVESKPENFANRGAKQVLSRELNLSWAASLVSHNKMVEGDWWHDTESENKSYDKSNARLSVEKSMAENLGLALGDRLTFKIADQFVEANVVNLREVDWGSFRANFYVITEPGVLDEMPTTYMSPFYLSPEKFRLLNRFVKEFPNVTVIDVASIMTHVRKIIDRVTMAVEYVFIFTLLSGVMVLLAGIHSTHDERLFESAISRTMGARTKQIYQTLASEFVCLGLLSGLVGAVLASLVGGILSYFVLKSPVTIHFELWAVGLFAGAIGIGLIGLFGGRQAVTESPMKLLKKLSN